MKFYIISFSFLFLLACNSESKTEKKASDSTSTTITSSPGSDTSSIPAMDSSDLQVKTPAGNESAAPLVLKFNFQEGKTYVYGLDMSLKQEGQNQNMTSKMQMGYSMKVTEIFPTERVLQVTYDKIGMNMNMGGMSQSFSSESEKGASTTPLQLISNMLRAMKGKSFLMTVGNDGEIKKVTGFDKIAKEVVSELGLPKEAQAAMIQNFQNQFNDKAIRESFAQSFSIFPSTPVKVGDSWNRKANLTVGSPMVVDTKYTVTNIEGNIVTIKAESEQDLEGGKAKGKALSILKVDARTGLVTRGNISHKTIGENMEISSEGLVTGKEL